MERVAEELRFEEAAQIRDRILELKGEKRIERGIGGLRKKRGKRASLPKSMRGTAAAFDFPGSMAAEDPRPYGRKPK